MERKTKEQLIRELKEALILAHEEKNKSEAIIAGLGDGIIIQDTEYKILYQNQIQKELYGDKTGELCYRKYEGRDEICEDCPVEKTFMDGKIHRSERKVVTDKGVSYFELTSSPLRDSNGKIIAGIKVVRDITASRAMEQTLRESEEKYRRLVETLMEGIWVLDKNANTTFVNPRMAQMLGYTIDEMLGKHLFYFMDEQGRMNATRYLERRQQCIQERHDFEFIRKDGTRIYTSLETSPITDENGNYSGAVAAIADITERKREDDEKNSLLKAIASSTDGITICDEKDRYIYVNAAYAKMFGYSQEDFIGETWRKITPSEMIAPTEEGLKDTLHNKDTGLFKGEVAGLKKDGGIVPMEVMATALWDENRNYNGHICIVRDITERKRAEEALHEGERFLENIFASIQDGIGIIDVDMNIIRVNKTTQSWYPYAAPLVGKKCYEAYHGRKERCELCPASEALKTGKSAYKVIPKHGPEGKEVGWLEIYSYPLRDTSTGQMNGVIEYVRDITERRRVEEELRQSGEKYRLLIHNIHEGVFIIQDAKMQFVNPKFADITGYMMEEIIGRDFQNFVAPENLEMVKERYSRRLKGEDVPQEYEFHVLRRDGGKILVSMNVGIVTYLGRVASMGILKDITERKKVEEAIKRYTKELEESNRMKELFMDIMHHDLLNPINVAHGYVEIFLDDETNPMKRSYLETIKRNLVKGIELIDNATKFSKLESMQNIEFEDIDLKKAVTEAIENLTPLAAKATIRIENRLNDKMPARANNIIEDVFAAQS
ncbi:MAG: PAS domain S-box protein [Candidatus Methanoperedens sp.]|nr:PAS domain S-box protein [Candidatus Methanoperedens sp.]